MYTEILKEFPEVSLDNTLNSIPVLKITTPLAKASISLYGGHILSFTPAGHQPVLWVSSKSDFEPGKAIRGGVPICWPWFGPSPVPGRPGHGSVRLAMWHLDKIRRLAGGALAVTLFVSDQDCDPDLCDYPFFLELTVTIGQVLEIQLAATNIDENATHSYQAAIHSYFAISEIDKITVSGIAGLNYFDKVLDTSESVSPNCPDLEIDREIDRIYIPASGTINIADSQWRRTVKVEKCGSISTIIWNPWIAKSQRMRDFGDNEYLRMICVESANVLDDAREVAPGETTVITQKISVEKWD